MQQMFQSTHPRGVRPEALRQIVSQEMFQSTHPRGVRRSRPAAEGCHLEGFNPRTPVGCDTHTAGLLCRSDQFQSTPPRGVRRGAACEGRKQNEEFQSTHPRGVRPVGLKGLILQLLVSIHAPPWGATLETLWIGQHRLFQSTHPRGVRPYSATAEDQKYRFNPRTPVGCDTNFDKDGCIWPVSIHAPPWGATASSVQRYQ